MLLRLYQCWLYCHFYIFTLCYFESKMNFKFLYDKYLLNVSWLLSVAFINTVYRTSWECLQNVSFRLSVVLLTTVYRTSWECLQNVSWLLSVVFMTSVYRTSWVATSCASLTTAMVGRSSGSSSLTSVCTSIKHIRYALVYGYLYVCFGLPPG